MRRAGLLLCMIGPSGGGKTTFAARLVSEGGDSTRSSVSLTTRAPRADEIDGVHYHFVTRDEFMERAQRGEFFEWEEVHGNCYGTRKSTLEEAIASGIDLILDVDIRGALSLKRAYPAAAVILFLAPPSASVLRERIRARGSISDDELARRLTTARQEYERLTELLQAPGTIDYFVVNNEREDTYRRVRAIVEAERVRLARLELDDVRAICRID